MSAAKVINLEGLIDTARVRVIDTSPILSLRPYTTNMVEAGTKQISTT